MRKFHVLFLGIVLTISSIGCKKSYVDVERRLEWFRKKAITSYDRDFVKLVDTNSVNAKKINGRSPDWDNAFITTLSLGQALVVPFHHLGSQIVRSDFSNGAAFRLDDVVRMVFYIDKQNQLRSEVLTIVPDSSCVQNALSFSGIVLAENATNILTRTLLFDVDNKVKTSIPVSNGVLGMQHDNRNLQESEIRPFSAYLVEVCYTLNGFNYAAADPDGYYWSQSLGCEYHFTSDNNTFEPTYSAGDISAIGGGGGGGASSPGPSPANKFSLAYAPDPITNFKHYTQCFSNLPGSEYSYNVMLCVTQPNPGSRETWGAEGSASSSENPFISVGHTFLVLSQNGPNGSITRNVGFYPAGGVSPISPRDQGILNNDAGQGFDIAVNIKMSSSQFFQVLEYLKNGNSRGFQYDLNSNNCTTFALNALGAANVQLPRTKGTWLNGRGLNPGDLGEDLREMQLPAGMTRTTLTGSHPNEGNCSSN